MRLSRHLGVARHSVRLPVTVPATWGSPEQKRDRDSVTASSRNGAREWVALPVRRPSTCGAIPCHAIPIHTRVSGAEKSSSYSDVRASKRIDTSAPTDAAPPPRTQMAAYAVRRDQSAVAQVVEG